MYRLTMFHSFLVTLALTVPLAAHEIARIEINQAIGIQKNGNLKFVAGKDTVARAFLSEAATVDPARTSARIIRNGELVATLSANNYEGSTPVVEFLCPTRDACGSWAAGDYAFEVKVGDASKTTEGTTYTFAERATVRILAMAVKANYGGTIVPVTDGRWKAFADFVRKTYPVGADKLVWVTREEFDASDRSFDLETDQGRFNLWEALAKLIPASCAGNPNEDGCYTQVFGFVMDRANGYPNGTLQGYTYGKPANIGVVRDEDAAATVAHEIGHTYGLGDTYNGGSFACGVNPAPDSFKGKQFEDSTKEAVCSAGREPLGEVGGTRIPAAHHPYEVGGRGPLGDSAEYMGSGGNQSQFWTTQDAYDHLYDKLVPTPGGGGGGALMRYIQCFGTIRQNASSPADVQVDPCWTFYDTDTLSNTTGPYMLAAVNAAGARVATVALDPEFDPVAPKGLAPQHVTTAPFAGEVAFPEGTTKFQIIRDGNVVKELPVTANAPAVSNVGPQLSGAVNGEVTVTWDATDADGDRLSYEVEYNADVTDEESDWEVLLRDLSDPRFTIDFTEMAGGPHAKVRVWATDGVNTTSAESAEFRVAPKAPDVFIEDLPNGGVYLAGQDVILDGDAYDLQDEDIGEGKMRWTSSISGPLGAGTPIKVANLPAGVHQITLSVTNSLGLTGTENITVRVVERLRRRNVKR